MRRLKNFDRFSVFFNIFYSSKLDCEMIGKISTVHAAADGDLYAFFFLLCSLCAEGEPSFFRVQERHTCVLFMPNNLKVAPLKLISRNKLTALVDTADFKLH